VGIEVLPGQQFLIGWKDGVYAIVGTILVAVGAIVAGLLILAAAAGALFVYIRREIGSGKTAGSPMEEVVNGHGMRIAQLEVTVKGLPSLWDEEVKRAKRSMDSARKARDSAEEKLDAVEELIAENMDVRENDGGGGREPSMQPVPSGLAPSHEADLEGRVAAVAHLLR